MEALLFVTGFLFGLVGNIWVSNILSFPRSQVLQYINWLVHPFRTFLMLISPTFWCCRKVLHKIYRSWELEDFTAYSELWHQNAIQVTGEHGEPKNREKIFENFKSKMNLYNDKRTTLKIITGFENMSSGDALLYVLYQIRLIRKSDGMPVIEEANEVYRLKEFDGKWMVTHNYDHFVGVSR